MTAAENKNNRNCKSLVFGARWLVIKKNLARDKKVIDCAGSRETKHGKALSWPCFAATAKKKLGNGQWLQEQQEIALIGTSFFASFVASDLRSEVRLWSIIVCYARKVSYKVCCHLVADFLLFASNANIVRSEHLNIVHNQKNSPEHKSENGFLVNPPKIVGESHRPS